MFSIFKPSSSNVAKFLDRQSHLEFNYPDVGCTVPGHARPFNQRGYDSDQVEAEVGRGDEAFEHAKVLLQQWHHFRVGWVEASPTTVPMEPGSDVAVQARIFGLWALAAVRIIEVDDRSSDAQPCFAYSIGTLPGHPEQGEERFEIAQGDDGRVSYRITAFFRANIWGATIAWPYLRYRFNQFRRQSVATMKQSISEQLQA